jgi:hypothetical protein
MGNIEFVAAVGTPLNTIGCLIPAFQKRSDRLCFQAGDSSSDSLSYEMLAEAAEHQAAILFHPVAVEGEEFKEELLLKRNEKAERYGLNAYVLYFFQKTFMFLKEEMSADVISKTYQGTILAPRVHDVEDHNNPYGDCLFILFSKSGLMAFVGELYKKTCQYLDRCLSERIEQDGSIVIGGEEDILSQLTEVIMNIAYDNESIRKAISYRGLLIMKSRYHSNFDEWLDITLDSFPSVAREQWINYAMNIYNRIVGERKAGLIIFPKQVSDTIKERPPKQNQQSNERIPRG